VPAPRHRESSPTRGRRLRRSAWKVGEGSRPRPARPGHPNTPCGAVENRGWAVGPAEANPTQAPTVRRPLSLCRMWALAITSGSHHERASQVESRQPVAGCHPSRGTCPPPEGSAYGTISQRKISSRLASGGPDGRRQGIQGPATGAGGAFIAGTPPVLDELKAAPSDHLWLDHDLVGTDTSTPSSTCSSTPRENRVRTGHGTNPHSHNQHQRRSPDGRRAACARCPCRSQ
jgi:hypothetical protein